MIGCSACGREWPDGLHFCGSCGAELTLPGSLASTPTVDEELRHATVLFADLVGFTSFSEQRAADEVGAVVADVLPRLIDVLRRHGGTAEKYLGDAVLSTFGLRHPDPQAGRSAVRAALELQRTMAAFRAETGHDLHLRIGVHAGELMLRRINNSWAVVGDTVNTAARLQEVADPDTVWISRALYEEIRRYVEVIPRPTLPLKGKTLPVQPYEVRRMRDQAGTPTLPFAGRDKELAHLTGELDRAIEQRTARVVVIRGQAGVGKSRLVTELQDRLEGDDRLFRLDRVEYDRADVKPAGGLAELIRHRFRLDPEADDAALLAALRAGAATELGDDGGERQIEFLAFVLGAPVADSGIGALEGEALWTGAYAAVHSWMQARARTDPWVLTFEDAHFGDPETAAFLDWSLTIGWDAPVFIVVTVREEDFSLESQWFERITRWLGEEHASEVVLHELAAEELTEALLALPDTQLPRAVAERVAEHAEGHPLFALELVDFLAAKGALADPARMSTTVLPSTVREAMEARIEQLGSEGKQLAKRAAFIGRRFTREAVARLWEGSEEALDKGFDTLRDTRTVFEEAAHGTDGTIELVFRHGRLQEAALARVPREERLRWHTQLEDWAHSRLKESPEDLDRVALDVIPLIARSRAAHEDDAGAADWYESLGLVHRRQHQSTEAAAAFLAAAERTHGTRRQLLQLRAAAAASTWGDLGRALAILDTTDDDLRSADRPVNPMLTRGVDGPLDRWWEVDQEETQLARRLQRADLLSRTGRLAEAASEFAELGGVLAALSSRHSRQLHLTWGRDYVFYLAEVQGDVEAALEVQRRCRALVSPGEPEPHELLVMDDHIAMRSGDMARAVDVATRRLTRALEASDLIEQSVGWNSLGIVRTSLGDLAGAAEAYRHSLELTRDTGDLRGEAIALHNIGILHLDRGELELARAHHEQYLTRSLRIGNWMANSYARIYLGLAASDEGDVNAAIRLLRQGWDAAERGGWPRLAALCQAMRGEVQLLHGVRIGDEEMIAVGTQAILAQEQGWRGLDDVGELYAVAAAGAHLSGDDRRAQDTLTRAASVIHPTWTVATVWIATAAAFVAGEDVTDNVAWLRTRDFHRAASMMELFAAAR